MKMSAVMYTIKKAMKIFKGKISSSSKDKNMRYFYIYWSINTYM